MSRIFLPSLRCGAGRLFRPRRRRQGCAGKPCRTSGVHAGLRRTVDEIAQEGIRVLAFARAFAPAEGRRSETPRFCASSI